MIVELYFMCQLKTAGVQYIRKPQPKAIMEVKSDRSSDNAGSIQAIRSYHYSGRADVWRPKVRYYLKTYGVYSVDAENFILHIFDSEGNQVKGVNGSHIGLAQMDDNWGTVEQRQNPDWVIRRVCLAYQQGGYANLRKHWCNHHKCRW